MSDLDRVRAQRLMGATGIDALVFFQPEAFRYAIGAHAGVATMWGRAGSAIAVVPSDTTASLAAVISDHAAAGLARLRQSVDIRTHRIWIDGVTLTGQETIADIDAAYRHMENTGSRPETFDQEACFRLLADILTERGMDKAVLGADFSFLPAADFERLKKALPHVTWKDASDILLRLRAIKNPGEIERLRRAARAAEAGLRSLTSAVKPDASLRELSAAWLQGARDEATAGAFGLSGHWDYISVGPNLTDGNARVKPGFLIKADVGTLVDGYSSDGARTFVLGQPAALATDLHAILHEAFLAGLEQIRPGRRFGDVHAAMLARFRKNGLNEYHRGHFGHSVGGNAGIEEWPFFSNGNDEVIEQNMVVALETPFYAQGFGALMIEDQFLVTETGTECMNSLPRDIIRIG